MQRDSCISSVHETLREESAEAVLLELSFKSKEKAWRLADDLLISLSGSKGSDENTTPLEERYPINLPRDLAQLDSKSLDSKRHIQTVDPLETARLCTESILTSLSKVASGGSQASSDLQKLEASRRLTDGAVNDIASAIAMRQMSSSGADALSGRHYSEAAHAVHDFSNIFKSQRAIQIAGPHAIRTHERTKDVLQRTILDQYENAVAETDLKGLSELTPLLGLLNLADKGVGLYLRYSQNTLQTLMNSDLDEEQNAEDELRSNDVPKIATYSMCNKLAKLFNIAVTHLRHHLPMVAYSLGEADGDAALVQLVHIEVEKRTIAIIRHFLDVGKWKSLQSKSQEISKSIEEKCISGEVGMDAQELLDEGDIARINKSNVFDMMDDCGFRAEIGQMSQLNSKLDELALLIQHTESYDRFIRHAEDEVNKARKIRRTRKIEEKKQQWISNLKMEGKVVTLEESEKFDIHEQELETGQRFQSVLPPQTQLNEIMVEVGGCLSGVERVFLLASVQRSFFHSSFSTIWNIFSPLTIISSNSNEQGSARFDSRALQTIFVEESMYAAQQSTQRAFATGHNATAAAATNFCSDILGRILLDTLSQRAQLACALLKPGDGLIPGQAGLSQVAFAAMTNAQKGLTRKVVSSGSTSNEELAAKRDVENGIAKACAHLNDLEVGVEYIRKLQDKLNSEMQSSFPPNRPETEQLSLCVQSLSAVVDNFKNASDGAIDHLINILLPRLRSIVNEFIGQEAGGSTGYTNVLGTGGTSTQNVKLNYNLDEKGFEMLQIGESYMTLLCQQVEELLEPLRPFLAPRLSDILVLGVIGNISKRLESAIKKVSLRMLKSQLLI